MASVLWVALLATELSMLANPGSSVAPGDKEQLCEQLRSLGAAPTPAYSANMRVLLDSWNYQSLLRPRAGAVWDQVDNDTNNVEFETTNWIQQSNTPCQQTVQACGFRVGPQNNWLITQLINRTVNRTRLPQVSVMIEFELRDCDVTLNCQRTFNTHIYETSTENVTAARSINNFRQVQRVSPDVTTGARVNETVVVNFNTNHSSFYFVIQDETTCIIITRLIAFYHVCPRQTINLLTHVPETIAPAIGSSPIAVYGHCIKNALTEDGYAPRLICSSGGMWILLGSGCRCAPGHVYYTVSGECTSLYQLACESLDRLISHNINTRELECMRKSDCSGVQCFSRNSFLENFVDLFDLTFLPCAKPSPVLWLQLLSREDPTNNNRRDVILSRNVTESGSVDLSVSSGDLIFGVYRFTANFSEDSSTIAIAAQLITSGVTTPVVNYTNIWLDTGKCPIESTATPPSTTDTPATPFLNTTTAIPPTSGPVLTPPDVEPHCSHVNWRNSPNVSCEGISGYVVRLFNPDTNETVERRVDTSGTFHNFLPLDKDLIEKKSTTVQVRVISPTGEGPYSSPIEVGCYKPPPPSNNIYFELKGERYDNNSEISIFTIGEGDNALLCKTNKQDCCGTLPDRFGEFYYPNGVRVPVYKAGQDFYRNRGEQLIRLNRRPRMGSSFPTGRYFCEIPDADNVIQKIFINII